MKLLQTLMLTSALLVSGMATATDDEVYLLPTQSIVLVCKDSEFKDIPKEEFDAFFSEAIPLLREIKNEGGLVGASYLTNIRDGIIVAFKDTAEHTAVENTDRFEAKIGEIIKELGTNVERSSCERLEIGGQMM